MSQICVVSVKFLKDVRDFDRNYNIVEKGKKNTYGECRKNFNDTIRFLVEHYPNVLYKM
jgi:hypothetical protein